MTCRDCEFVTVLDLSTVAKKNMVTTCQWVPPASLAKFLGFGSQYEFPTGVEVHPDHSCSEFKG